MRTQILIQQGMAQVVLTPETEFEKTLVSSIKPGSVAITAHRGTFNQCQGGWVREFDTRPNTESLILVLTEEKPDEPTLPDVLASRLGEAG